jgi:hypothetical protein
MVFRTICGRFSKIKNEKVNRKQIVIKNKNKILLFFTSGEPRYK